MHIGIAIGLFIVSYIIELLLCFKAQKRHTKLIPFYIGFVLAFIALMLYMGAFGDMSMGMLGNGHGFLALIILIAILIMFTALFLALITHAIYKHRICNYIKKNNLEREKEPEYVYLCEKEAIYAGMLSDILEQNSIPFTTNNVLGAGITSKIGYAAEIVRFFVHKDYFEIAKELEESYLSEKENV